MNRILIISFTILCLGPGAIAQGTFELSLTNPQIKIGQQTQLMMRIIAGPADQVEWPQIGDTLTKEIEVVKSSKVDTTFEGDDLKQVLTQTLTITSFDTGYFPIEPLLAKMNGDIISSNPTLLSVAGVKLDSAIAIRDIKAIAEVPFSLKEWLIENWKWLVGGLLAIILITILAYWHSLRKKPVEEAIRIEPQKPPYEWATERIEELERQKLWQNGKTKDYYSGLTDIVREYIERQFFIPALEQNL